MAVGAVPAGATPPTYNGVKPIPPGVTLAYEGAPFTQVDANDPLQWIKEVVAARADVKTAQAELKKLEKYSWPATPDDVPVDIREQITAPRRRVAPYNMPGSHKNETPRYVAGMVDPADMHNPRMNYTGSVQMHLETINYRLPKEHIQKINWQAIDDAHAATKMFSDTTRYHDGLKPDIKKSEELLTKIDELLADVMKNQGEKSSRANVFARINNRLFHLTPTQSRWVIGGAIAAAAGVGAIVGISIATDG